MSYCVNCGVELAASEKSCPLCGVETQNPQQPWVEPESRPYPQRVDKIVQHVDRKFGVWLASLFLLIPAFVTLIGNLLTSHRVTWSAYVMGACGLLYIIVLFPLLFKKPRPYLFALLDAAATALYLLLIDISAGGDPWFLRLALPITLIAGAGTILAIFILRLRDYPNLYKAAILLSATGVMMVALNIVLNAYHNLPLRPGWSLFVLAPCVVLSVMMIYTESHKTLKEEIRRRLFY